MSRTLGRRCRFPWFWMKNGTFWKVGKFRMRAWIKPKHRCEQRDSKQNGYKYRIWHIAGSLELIEYTNSIKTDRKSDMKFWCFFLSGGRECHENGGASVRPCIRLEREVRSKGIQVLHPTVHMGERPRQKQPINGSHQCRTEYVDIPGLQECRLPQVRLLLR